MPPRPDPRALAADILSFYRNTPVAWIRDVLKIDLTEDQKAVCRSLVEHDRTLVQSSHTTGKTLVAAALALHFACHHEDAEVLVTSSSLFQVKNRLFAEIVRLCKRAAYPLGGRIFRTQVLFPRSKVCAVSTDDGSNVQGGHSPHMLLVIDEAHAVDETIWISFESMMTGSGSRTLGLFNPISRSGPAYDRTCRPDEWSLVKLSALRHPNVVTGREVVKGAVTRKWVEERRRVWGEDNPLYVSRVVGEFPPETEDTLVSLADFEASSEIAAPLPGDGPYMGVDVARFGSDLNCAVVLVHGRVVTTGSWGGLDTMATVGEIRRMQEKWGVPWERVVVDATGVGGGVVDRLREQGFEVVGVDLGSRPHFGWDGGPFAERLGIVGTEYANLRAELFWILRNLLRRRMLAVPRRFETIWADTLAHRFSTRSDGKILVEAKAEVRRRLGRSPDASDALLLALVRERPFDVSQVVQFV